MVEPMGVTTLIFKKSLFSTGFADEALFFNASCQYFFKNVSMRNYVILINTNKLQDQKIILIFLAYIIDM